MLQRRGESSQPVDRRLPRREIRIYIDEPGERVGDLPERLPDLHKTAELDRAGEEPGRGHDQRKNDRQLPIERLEPGDLLALEHDLPPVADHRGKALVEPGELFLLAAVERHSLAVLAQPHERKPEVRLEALLIEIEADERLADEVGEHAADDGVDQGRPDHVARNRDPPDLERAGNRP